MQFLQVFSSLAGCAPLAGPIWINRNITTKKNSININDIFLFLCSSLCSVCTLQAKSQTMEEDLKAKVSFFTSTSNSSSPNLRPSVVAVLNYKVLKLLELDAKVVPARLRSRRRCWQVLAGSVSNPPPLSPHQDHLPIPSSCKTRLAIHPWFVRCSTSQQALCKRFP